MRNIYLLHSVRLMNNCRIRNPNDKFRDLYFGYFKRWRSQSMTENVFRVIDFKSIELKSNRSCR